MFTWKKSIEVNNILDLIQLINLYQFPLFLAPCFIKMSDQFCLIIYTGLKAVDLALYVFLSKPFLENIT